MISFHLYNNFISIRYYSHFIGDKTDSKKFSAQNHMARQNPDLFNSIAYPLYHTAPERICEIARFWGWGRIFIT